MNTWSKAVAGMVVAIGVSDAMAQVPGVGAPLGAPPAGPLGIAPAPAAPGGRTVWDFFGISQAKCEYCRRKICQTPLGMMLSSGLTPVTALTGGIIPSFCPITPSIAELMDSGAVGAAAQVKKDEAEAKARRAAVRYLGTVDCHYWPEAEEALIASLRADRNECVRWEAALALGNGCCCTRRTIEALVIAASCSDRDGNPKERSDRVRMSALAALIHCLSCFVDVSTVEAAPTSGEQLPLPKKDTPLKEGEDQNTPKKVTGEDKEAADPKGVAKGADGVITPVSATSGGKRKHLAGAYYDTLPEKTPKRVLAEARLVVDKLAPQAVARAQATNRGLIDILMQNIDTTHVAPAVSVYGPDDTRGLIPAVANMVGSGQTTAMPLCHGEPMVAPPPMTTPIAQTPVPRSAYSPATPTPSPAKLDAKPALLPRSDAAPAPTLRPVPVTPVSTAPMKPAPVAKTMPAPPAIPAAPSVPAKTQWSLTVPAPVESAVKPASVTPPVVSTTTPTPPKPVTMTMSPPPPVTQPSMAPALPMLTVAPTEALTPRREEAGRLLAILKDSNYSQLRRQAVEALHPTDVQHDPVVVTALVTAARKDPEATVRVACIRSLGGNPANVSSVKAALRELTDDDDVTVRTEASLTLARLGTAK